MAETTVSSAYDSSKISSLVGMAIKNETSRVTTLQIEKSRLAKAQTVTASLKTSLSSLRTAVAALAAEGAMEPKKAAVSDALIFGASASSAASAGSYALDVISLAASHKLGSSSLTDAGATLITAEGVGVKTFRIAVGETTEDISVTLAEGDTDNAVLAKIMDAVNSGSENAKASLIKETSGTTTLVIEAADSGLEGALTLTDVSGTLLKSAGMLTALGANARQLQAASDARFTIGGTITVTRSSNEISDAIAGVTLNLVKAGAATLSISTDADAVAAKFTAFVTAYNSVQTALGTQISEAPDSASPEKGIFYANRQLRTMRSGLRLRLAEGRELDLASLAAIGFKPVDAKTVTSAQSYNISFDTAAFKTALQATPGALRELVGGTTGIMTLVSADLDAHLASYSGTFAALESSTTSRMTTADRRLLLAQKSVTQKTAYYTALYTSLAGKISSMQSQSSTASSIYTSVFGTNS